MDKLKALTTNALKQRQSLAFMLALGGLVLTIFILVWLSSGDDAKNDFAPTDITKISTSTANIDNESIWVQKSESLLEQLQQNDKAQKHQIDELKTLIQSKQQEEVERQAQKEQELTNFLDKLHDLQNQLKQVSIKANTQVSSYASPTNDKKQITSNALELPTIGITKGHFNLESIYKNQKHISHYIPAGSHVKAVILGGVDASASVSAQSDPKPVLLRLADNGVLPNQFNSKLKDCHITAAAYGDISSERALMRLETISCVNKQGEVLESQVSGYVAGEDGITGVRGQMVFRERELLNHSLLSGILSGIGKGIENKFTTVSQSALGATSTVANEQILKTGVASGASNALEKYAEYHINRAEQYQPTIQIGAGRVVDVVFTKGWALKEINKSEEKENG